MPAAATTGRCSTDWAASNIDRGTQAVLNGCNLPVASGYDRRPATRRQAAGVIPVAVLNTRQRWL